MEGDRNLAIFRRFDDISVLRLLSLQAEILELRAQFDFQCKKNDISPNTKKQEYSRSFAALRLGEQQGEEQARVQTLMFSKLDEYCESSTSYFHQGHIF